MKGNKPVQEIRLGSIKAAIWENAVGEGVRHSVTLARLYKDGEEWRSTDTFGRDDLLVVAKVADQAHSWIWRQRSAANRPETDPAREAERASGRPRPARSTHST